ncbi:head-tail connector protein [Planctomyces sp. SH-PL14]|uniref:head-tail connector protein n=1 Tax=Planctomyces sp. SH-PL14 TaxID=1632864 RepID=UPI00078E0E6B|nr:head-tail connector protein [Planctomyces sp. SH-PL14]AMV20413.1 Phage gp6-like head-tail connector protein [Planctomyces sp. SH-PL14]
MNALELNAAYVTTEAPTASIVDAARLRRQCRVDSASEDADLLEWLATATKMIEDETSLFLRPQEGVLNLDRFPGGGCPIFVERFPIAEVTGITYLDTNGVRQTWDPELYIVGLSSLPPRITPAFGQSYPTVRRQSECVQIAYTGGYSEAEVPPMAKQAALMLVGFWYQNREIVGDVPKNIEDSYRSFIRRISWRAP